MKHIRIFENFEKEPERKEKPIKKEKKVCIGQCDRKFFLKDGKPVVYCPSCDRILN